MSCKARLIAVNDKDTTRNRLPEWTDRDPDEMITQAQQGKKPVITTVDCNECEEALEKDGAAEVEVEQC